MHNAIKYAHQNFFICALNRLHNVGFVGGDDASPASELAEVSDFDMVEETRLMRANRSVYLCRS